MPDNKDYVANASVILRGFHEVKLMSRDDQAKAARISRQTLTDLLAGRTCPRRSTLDRIAGVIGKPFAEIVRTRGDSLCRLVPRARVDH